MDASAIAVAISTLAASIAQGKSVEELAALAVIFTQLGDTLATISLLQDQSRQCKRGDVSKQDTQE